MDILYVMVPLGLVLVAGGLWAFFWAVGSGQFDDLDSPGWTVLEDEQGRPTRNESMPADADARAQDSSEPPRS